MAQFCIEEAVFERLEQVERAAARQVRAATGEAADWDGTGDPPGISPGQQQAAEHHARFRELGGQLGA